MANSKTAKKPAAKKKPAKKTSPGTPKSATSKPEAAAAPSPAPGQVELIGLEELAEQLRLPPARIRQMLRTGQIQGVKVDDQWRFNAKLVFQSLGRRARGR